MNAYGASLKTTILHLFATSSALSVRKISQKTNISRRKIYHFLKTDPMFKKIVPLTVGSNKASLNVFRLEPRKERDSASHFANNIDDNSGFVVVP